MKVTLWEVKASDGQAINHNTKIYEQLSDYPRRFFTIANCMSANYTGDDIAIKKFLRNMALMAKNRQSQVHYGVFVVYNASVRQKGQLIPSFHRYPDPSPPGQGCHHLMILLIPDFKDLRLKVWRSLHLI